MGGAETLGGKPGPGRRHRLRRLLSIAVPVVVAAFAANAFGVRGAVLGTAGAPARPMASVPVAAAATRASSVPTGRRSQPWWRPVISRDGTAGSAVVPFTVAAGALEWRLTWTCPAGHLLIASPDRVTPLVDAGCPDRGRAYATRTGASTLRVEAGGPWQVAVDEHVDVPLVEPPLRAMTENGAAALGSESLYGIDEAGMGTAALYQLPDGRYALRLENFFVTANTGLELRLSTVAAPHSTEEYTSGPSSFVAPLEVTAGSLNVDVPRDLDITKYRSLVVWCPAVNSAYAAAALGKGSRPPG